jgi:hypothetical protein
MIQNHVGRRLIAFIPIALAAIFLIVIGPEKLGHLKAPERWELLVCLLFAFVASNLLGRYLRPMTAGASAQRGMLVGYLPNRTFRKPVVLHSALAPEAIADTLLRSIDEEVVLQSVMPWFVRLFWKGGSREVRGLIDGNTFRLKRWNAWQWSPNFYGKWEADHSGTRIEGYFELAPVVRWSLRLTLVVIMGLAVLGVVLNTLDLTAGTHFTLDPDIGLAISVFLLLFTIGLYLVAHWLGSRQDEGLLGFLEKTLAASRIRQSLA